VDYKLYRASILAERMGISLDLARACKRTGMPPEPTEDDNETVDTEVTSDVTDDFDD
jgi:hypothetical protein